MPEIHYADRFVDHVAAVYSDRVLEELAKAVDAIVSFPEIGSSNVRQSLVERFGAGIRKMPVGPFVIIYRYQKGADLLEFIAMPYGALVK